MSEPAVDWPNQLYDSLRAHEVTIFGHVPDAGHKVLINRAYADPAAQSIGLTIESEGIGLLAGAHLGGQRAVLAMQSSGVGNCINLLSLIQIAQFPFVALVSMRGDFGEQNAWQYPMGQATEATLQAMNVRCYWVHQPDDVVPTVTAAVNAAYAANQATAVLLSQKLIGAKPF